MTFLRTVFPHSDNYWMDAQGNLYSCCTPALMGKANRISFRVDKLGQKFFYISNKTYKGALYVDKLAQKHQLATGKVYHLEKHKVYQCFADYVLATKDDELNDDHAPHHSTLLNTPEPLVPNKKVLVHRQCLVTRAEDFAPFDNKQAAEEWIDNLDEDTQRNHKFTIYIMDYSIRFEPPTELVRIIENS